MHILGYRAHFDQVGVDWSINVLKIMIGHAKNKKFRKYKKEASEQTELVHRTA